MGSLCWCQALRVTMSQVIRWMCVWVTALLPPTQDSLHTPSLAEHGWQSEAFLLFKFLQLLLLLAISLLSAYFHSNLASW